MTIAAGRKSSDSKTTVPDKIVVLENKHILEYGHQNYIVIDGVRYDYVKSKVSGCINCDLKELLCSHDDFYPCDIYANLFKDNIYYCFKKI